MKYREKKGGKNNGAATGFSPLDSLKKEVTATKLEIFYE